ncbi:tetratricopeptide repeat protein [bacterium]|nr:tetratricopeptide repeat protein [bacterium]
MRKFSSILIIIFLFCSISLILADKSHDIELAKRFLAIEKYDKAVDVLEKLYIVYPDDSDVRFMLRQAYTGAKKYDKLSSLLQSFLLNTPDDADLWVELGGVYLSQNKPDDSWNAFDRAVSLKPKDKNIVIKIHNFLHQWSFIDDDIKFLKKSRNRLGNKNLFALELARLYEISGKFDNVVEEYSRYLKEHPDKFSEVERRISVSQRTPDELAQLRKSLNSLFDSRVPRWQPWQLISIVEQKLGHFDKSLDAMINAENSRDEKRRGMLMASFVGDMLKAKQFAIAEKGARYMFEKTGGNYSRTGRFYRARALQGMGKYNDALIQLDTLMMAKVPPISQDAAVFLAQILLENLHNPDSAQQIIENYSENTYGRNSLGENGLIIEGSIYIYKAQFDKAKLFLADAFKSNSNSQRLAYMLGMTYFFSESYDTASTALHNIVAKFPKSSLGNEAVELLLIMETAKDELEQIRKPIYLMFIHDTLSAKNEWAKIAEKTNSEIGDYILWKLGICQLALGSDSGYTTMQNLYDKFPKSFYSPLSLEILADSKIERGDTQNAIELYTKIINDYPDAVNIETVRDKLKMFGNL